MNIMRKISSALISCVDLFLIYMPGALGIKLRYFFYRRRFRGCGKNVIIDTGVLISGFGNISVGDNVHIDKYCVIDAGKASFAKVLRKPNPGYDGQEGGLFIGNDVHIVHFCMIMAYGGVYIADKCVLGAGTKIYSMSNLAYDPEDRAKVISIMPYEQAPFIVSPVVLGENVWIGLNGIVLPGASIGANSFVVSNSLVLSRFNENSYIAGQPAKKIRERFA